MSHLLHFAAVMACCLAAVRPLARARWVRHMPRTALMLWQTIGVTFELSILGLLGTMVFAPDNQGLVPGLAQILSDPEAVSVRMSGLVFAGLTGLFVVVRLTAAALSIRHTRLTRRRHRHLLDLVTGTDASLPGVDILDHPAAAAYCLPGTDERIVITTGALQLLDHTQLTTVLAHERAHLRQRHDLVVLPLESWRRLLPKNPLLEEAIGAVHLLLEMSADDACRRRFPGTDLAAALARFSGSPHTLATPAGGLGVADTAVAARAERLLTPTRPGVRARLSALVLATLAVILLATPLSLFVLPV
ncbi:M56 family metallopeptidase [Streptomyces sp. PSKA54]|uniref:M56 family metallopeptidase n=1 Tax=Streptomyces himalayensis subsp. aureolus TaxID=2758039 RepID=A0A7W2HHQ6_9ACTN|nr:M56 family metallopeptidase [Streptomyces himalayensis]MBA4864298.1 M56 family metallopeptidase [Streptomyces himalayensis subsp. aureolus]